MLPRILQVQLVISVVGTCCALQLDELEYRNCSAVLLGDPWHERMSDQDPSGGCPPWFFNDTGECRPGHKLGGIVQPDPMTLQSSLLECICMTEEDGFLMVGACMYACKAAMGYYPLPCHVSELQNFTCGDLHRNGQLCGKCDSGYSVPVYSYNLACVECNNYQYNWLKYLAVAFLPLTLFYILVTLFSVSFTSPLLSGLVMAFQIVAHPLQLQVFLSLMDSGMPIVLPQLIKVVLSIASVWNLDFFRMYYSFCLHPNASAMTIMALDFATTVYPVILIWVTYVLVKLYDHDFKLLVWPWRLISVILKPFQRQWNVKTSLIDVFASFIYLSSTRLLLTSVNFLVPIRTYGYQLGPDGHPKLTKAYYLFNSPTVKYFGANHLPFALLAITSLLSFFILPMALLFVYPHSWFQRMLNRTRLNSLTLRTFVEVFQGSFKDSTNNTRDYRYFSGFLLFIPLVLNLIFSLTQSSIYYPLGGLLILVYLTLHLIFRPYKRQLHNHITVAMLVALLIMYWGMAINCAAIAEVSMGDQILGYPLNNFSGVVSLSIVLLALTIAILYFYFLGLLCMLVIPKGLCCNQQQ